MDLQAMRMTVDRLKPIQRMLDSIKAAFEMVTGLEQDIASRKGEIEKHEATLSELRKDVADLEREQSERRTEFTQLLSDSEAARHQVAAELVVAKERAAAEFHEFRDKLAREQAAMVADHQSLSERLRKSQEAMQADHDRVKEALSILRKQVTA